MATELFQAQGMTGVAQWNYQRMVDLKQPGVILPAVFDPAVIAELKSASKKPLSAGAMLKQEMPTDNHQKSPAAMELSHALPLPLRSSPRSAHAGPTPKTGGQVFCVGQHTVDATHERCY